MKQPLDASLIGVREVPNTISLVIMLRMQYNSYLEFSEPLPEEHWDYPHIVRAHIEKMYPSSANKTTGELNFDEIND